MNLDKRKDRLKKRRDKLKGNIENLEGSSSKSKSGSGGVDYNDGGSCSPDVKGSCADGTLKAKKSVPSKGRAFQKKSSGLLNVSGKKKYKKLKRKKSRLAKMNDKIKANTPSTRYSNPRFL